MTPTPSGKRKMILDVDTGIDDALALAYLASFDDVEILGVIGTYGNVSADTAVRNTAYVLERLGFRDVPVMCGSTRPPGRPRSFPTPAARSSTARMDWADSARPLIVPSDGIRLFVTIRTSRRSIRHPMCPIRQDWMFERCAG